MYVYWQANVRFGGRSEEEREDAIGRARSRSVGGTHAWLRSGDRARSAGPAVTAIGENVSAFSAESLRSPGAVGPTGQFYS